MPPARCAGTARLCNARLSNGGAKAGWVMLYERHRAYFLIACPQSPS
ncbi:hypothetical protein X772_13440 [Mesorhizobium sp. LSJC280B00]|nr:hypothetical protein X772_13440 [Mesorhizobium sp. LSJC280B00]